MIEGNGAANRETQVEETTKKLEDLKSRIAQIKESNDKLYVSKDSANKDPTLSSDWTKSYEFWSKWEDLDDVKELQKVEESKLNEIISRPTFGGHLFDHGKEKQFFLKPESEKMVFCENHRLLGNHLYLEGNFLESIHHYRLAISYYEYCFPGTDFEQDLLDDVKLACYCNLSMCYFRQNQFRVAVDYATRAIAAYQRVITTKQERIIEDTSDGIAPIEASCDPCSNRSMGFIKAYYRRACAYRAMDEYELAQKDLLHALHMFPAETDCLDLDTASSMSLAESDTIAHTNIVNDSSDNIMDERRAILRELQILKMQKKCANQNQKVMMEYALNFHNDINDKSSQSIANSSDNNNLFHSPITEKNYIDFSVFSISKPLEPIPSAKRI